MRWDEWFRPGPRFGLRIILPTGLAIVLFVVALFSLVVPAYERQIMERKREMIRELTHSAVSILAEYEREEQAGALTREVAQREAVTRLRFLRYGDEGKDYFWITDLEPRMVMHPYRADLDGSDLREFADPGGKRLFVEMVEVARASGAGYVEFFWQWKDDPGRIVPKLSHIRAFEPWGWVVGTGIYIEDVRHEIQRLTAHLIRLSLGITAILTLLLLLIVQQSLAIDRRRGRAEASLRESRERYRALVDASTEGVALVLDGRITFANPTLRQMLGRADDDLIGQTPASVFPGLEGGEPDGDTPRAVRLERDGAAPREAVISSSAIRLGERDGIILTVREASPREQARREREELAVELQVSLQFLQEPVRALMREPVVCSLSDPIRRAAELMRRGASSAILVRAESGEMVGIVTDRDIRDRVVAGDLAPSEPVHRIMTSPLLTFPESGLAGEAILFMFERGIRHLAVRDPAGRIIGLLRDRELAASQRFSPAAITREIRAARLPEQIAELRARVPRLVSAWIDTGSPPRGVNRILTAVSDTTQESLIAAAIADLGPPPAPFAFIALGSDGREEQTLATDQDNALIYEDPPASELEVCETYFRQLGERVCGDLDRAGYTFCPGDIMARNPRWNRPLSAWIEAYRGWMEAPEPQDLLEFMVFFDFRCVGGDPALARRLREAIDGTLRRNPPFLLHLARHALDFRLPVGAFGRLSTEANDSHGRTFNLKEAMAPVVHVARLYALREGIEATNTLDRLQALHLRNVVKSPDYEEIVQVYEHLMRTRLRHQTQALRQGGSPDNHLPLESLTDLDRALLKQAASRIALLLKRVSYDFLGTG